MGQFDYRKWDEYRRGVIRCQKRNVSNVLGVPENELNENTPVPAGLIQRVFEALQYDDCSIAPEKLPTRHTTLGEIKKCVSGSFGGD